jgi:hypothetical protein
VKRLAVIGGLAAVGAVVAKKLRRGRDAGSHEHAWGDDTVSAEEPQPPTPAPPSEADPADREVESRLDDESKYERRLEEEEQSRAAAAERLRTDPPQPDSSDDG